MISEEKIARELVGAVAHCMSGKGPSSVILQGPHGKEDGCVVLIFPCPVGLIIDEALDKLYAHLGWKVLKRGQGEGS